MRKPNECGVDEVWFFTSEIEGERAGSFRQERWCRVFLEAGVRVSVFNVRGAFGLTEAQFDTLEEFAAFRKRALESARPMASVRQGFAARMLRRVKHLLLVDLYLPNVLKLLSVARRRLATSEGRVLVVASSPPFSLAVVGCVLKRMRRRQVVFAADMRDAWALHTSLGGFRPLKRLIERWTLRAADAVSTVSYGLKEEFEVTHAVKTAVLYNVATHYFDVGPSVPIDWRALHPGIEPERVKLVYTGSTPVGFYDLASLVSAVKRLRSARPDLAGRIQLIFVGACEEVRAELKRQGGAGNDIVVVPHVPHEVAKAAQQNADAVVFLAYFGKGNKGVVSTKFFEYLALGRPILPISLHEGSDVDRLLRTYCGESRSLHTASEIEAELRRVAENPERLPKLGDPTKVRHFLDDYRTYAQTLRNR
jgi:hypothetical protein